MGRFESIYLKLPTALQNVACSFIGWRNNRARFGGDFSRLLAESESRTSWTTDQVCEYRDAQLRKFIEHCAATVPFYRELFARQRIDPRDIRRLDDLQRLPILTKQQVQEQMSELQSPAIGKRSLLETHTSGTTGGGLQFNTTHHALREQWAVCWRYRHWHGLDAAQWYAYFGGRSVVSVRKYRPPYWRYNYPGRQIIFSGYHMNASTLGLYVDELRRRKPLWLHGYPSLIGMLAAHMLDHNIELGYPVRWITISSENLLPQQERMIRDAFGVAPIQHYAMAEGVANISQCPEGRMHVDEDFSAVEFVPNPHGSGYKVIGTNFTNYATPLVRYDVQDLVTLANEPCPCGRPGRIVAMVDGRLEDYVVLPNGTRLGRLDHIFKDMIRVREAQIHQREIGSITLRVVRGKGYSADDERQLRTEVSKRVGADMMVALDYVDSIPRTPTGKLRLVISDLKAGRLMTAAL